MCTAPTLQPSGHPGQRSSVCPGVGAQSAEAVCAGEAAVPGGNSHAWESALRVYVCVEVGVMGCC